MNQLVSPVTFKPCQLGRETVFLGDKLIGHVMPIEGRAYRAAAMLFLPDHPRQWPARSLEVARAIIEREVADWLLGAGLAARERERRRA